MEFVDTNILVYAHDGGSGWKQQRAIQLISGLFQSRSGALSTQVLTEFCAAATQKMGMPPEEAAAVIRDLSSWTIHRPALADIVTATEWQSRYKLSWWDSMILQSAVALGCHTLWTEDFSDGQRFGAVEIRNPFRDSPIVDRG